VQCLVVYDISDDTRRAKVADACLDYGLDRIQFSAFLGDLAATHQEELMLRLKTVLGKKAGNIQMFPICARDWASRKVIAIGEPGSRGGHRS
jgi:CRISPR-associated protein Cas2